MDTRVAGLARPPAYIPPSVEREPSSQIHDVVLHHLRTPAEIEGIIDLRDEIDLSVHTAAGRQQFERLEKKETSAGSCSDSNSAGSGSARSASSRWATN
ncbi:hypothetical protein [Ramlibacter sp. PS4R-6]|uniref:hypothetical protein n=1 Tax=Ramlibacter sp. PS4R-6 TaxID=3133438 RepID=UPI0030B67411